CVAFTRVSDNTSFPNDSDCTAAGFPGIVGTFFDVTFKGPAGTKKASVGDLTFRHPKSDASLRLLGALVLQPKLDATFQFFKTGAPTAYFTVQLHNAVVLSDDQYLPDT